ncbi:META domain-containing protein [Paracoccus shanxieyensis]|uniref:META domain-containing protein n=1 Tax=Paracoccus shanxieyensis TaxID=2675752 RepID=A0A6L6J4L8_9RHOB|nr:META domain-containing protein [Paracoccus shanxieyensis]MTH65707.1 META domain-containing protein [Paracoccus shanxieyensis]MTH88918.1 META domain-containing protein [Paracoccus shanxieyensis]
MTRILTLSAALAAVTALAACEPAAPSDPAHNIPTGQYVLVGIGSDTVPQRNVGLTINADGSISGQAPCNHYTATQTAEPPAFALSPVTNTRMACSGRAAELENRYFAALAQANGIKYEGGVLAITGPTYLTFEPGYRKDQ